MAGESTAGTLRDDEPAGVRNAHTLTGDEILSALRTNRYTGLATGEAIARLSKYGANELAEEKPQSALRIVISQFNNALMIILLAATIVSGFLGEIVDAIVILIILAIVAALGFSQEYRTERVLSALKKVQNHNANVLRDGKRSEVDVKVIVPGDIVLVGTGDKIPADMRALESYNLLVDEATLTGESSQVEKTTLPLPPKIPVAGRSNMLFSGTYVTSGRGLAVCVTTGMHTELGKIAQKVTERYPKSSSNIERRMNEIGRKIGLLVLVIIIVLVTVSLFEEYYLTGGLQTGEVLTILLFGVALAVAAIPEALPAILVGSLAIGAHRMAKERTLARNLSAVETLGSTQVICTDKTGTLTKGEMTVTEIHTLDKTFSISGVGFDPSGAAYDINTGKTVHVPDDMTRAMALCNDASLEKDGDGRRWVVRGDTTEGALLVLAQKLGLHGQNGASEFPRVWEIPFSSAAKRMTTVHRSPDGTLVAYMKGAQESVLEKCSDILGENGVEPLDNMRRDSIRNRTESMAAKSLRVLAIAVKKGIVDPENGEGLERDFTFLGLVGMIDPPRPEAIEAINSAKKIGIRPIMITGDHKTTAIAIAMQMGIFHENDKSLTGEQLDDLNDHEYEKIVEEVTVYARVTPSDKLRIVEAWQKKDRIVAMTGDGVNDAPALKRADIGIAMGITGTEVAKEASDMILLDDNFATILKAVRLGRWVQDNVKKYLAYLLSANLVEIIVLSVGILFFSLSFSGASGEPLVPLLAVQILYINLATDGLPALAIGIGPPEPDLMDRPVQKKGGPAVFGPEVRRFIYWVIATEAPLLLLIYFTGIPYGIAEARTRLFLAFVFIELVLALNSSSIRFPINRARPHRWLVLAVLWEVILLVVLLFIPYTRNALQILLPSIGDIEWTLVASIFTFVLIDVLKRLSGAHAFR